MPDIWSLNTSELYNIINGDRNEIINDFGTKEQYLHQHIIGSINLDLSRSFNEEILYDSIYNEIKNHKIKNFKIIFVFHQMIDTQDSFLNAQTIQKQFRAQITKIIPIYIYNGIYSFCNGYYSFLCKSGNNKNDENMTMRITYPNMIIDDAIFLGDMQQATNMKMLKDLKITHIINCTPFDYSKRNDININNIKYLQISVNDNYYERIDRYFESVYKFIDSALSDKEIDNKHRVLIHCEAGISRSVTITISYLMKKHKMTLTDALTFVKLKRSKVNPNQGFIKQLQTYDGNLRPQHNEI